MIEEIVKALVGTTAEVTVWVIFIAWLIFVAIVFLVVGVPLVLVLYLAWWRPRSSKKKRREESIRDCMRDGDLSRNDCERRVDDPELFRTTERASA